MKRQLICTTCGTYFFAQDVHEQCAICLDERQYIPEGGQSWTQPETLYRNYSMRINKISERLYELQDHPVFAIGQRALLILSEQGNILWDCVPLLDELTRAFIHSIGGLKAVACSHPHYYSNMNEWAETFNCPIYIHEFDAVHIMQTGIHIRLWKGEEQFLWEGVKIMLVGGHFEGSSILHVPFLSKEGSVLCGDSLFLSPSKTHFSIQRSYPNKIPLPLSEMSRLKKRFDAIAFDSFYGCMSSQNLQKNVKAIFETSMKRYFE